MEHRTDGKLYMSKFLWSTCAVSALALAYAAHADDSTYRLELQGTVPGFCNIATTGSDKPTFSTGDGATTEPAQGSINVIFTSFANADGTGKKLDGRATLHVNANAQCNYELRSINGALKNQQHAAEFRPYSAVAYPSSDSGVPVPLDGLSANRLVNSFSVDAPVSSATTSVNLDVSIPSSGVLAAGDYQDTLSLTVVPQG